MAKSVSAGQIVVVLLIALLVVSYTAGVIAGWIPKEHQLDAVHVSLIVLALLLCFLIIRPEIAELARGTTQNYHGGPVVRDELRRLRTAGLIKSLPDRHIADLHSDTTFDLRDWVELTLFGQRWAQRIRQIDRSRDRIGVIRGRTEARPCEAMVTFAAFGPYGAFRPAKGPALPLRPLRRRARRRLR